MGAICGKEELIDAEKLKIVFLGPPGSGKTSIVTRCASGAYYEDPTTTLQAHIYLVHYLIPTTGKVVFLELWDLPGESPVDLDEIYFANANAAVIVLDVNQTEGENLTAVGDAVERLNRHMTESGRRGSLSGVKKNDIATMLWMNKIDLLHPAPEQYPNLRHEISAYNEQLAPLQDQLQRLRTFLAGSVQLHQLHGSALVSARREPECELSLVEREQRPFVQVRVGSPLWDGIKEAIDRILVDFFPAPAKAQLPLPSLPKLSLPSIAGNGTQTQPEPEESPRRTRPTLSHLQPALEGTATDEEHAVLIENEPHPEALPSASLPPLHPKRMSPPAGSRSVSRSSDPEPVTPVRPMARNFSETPKTVTPSGLTMKFHQSPLQQEQETEVDPV